MHFLDVGQAPGGPTFYLSEPHTYYLPRLQFHWLSAPPPSTAWKYEQAAALCVSTTTVASSDGSCFLR